MTTEEEIIVNEDINEFSLVDPSLQEFKTWDSLDLKSDILRGVYAYGFDRPSAVQ
jgi:superfamily II DNA/RNA helicase